jgi:hypothetical protein
MGNGLRQIHGEVNEQIRCREIQLGTLGLKYGHHLFAAGEQTGGTCPMPPTGSPGVPIEVRPDVGASLATGPNMRTEVQDQIAGCHQAIDRR